MFIYKRTFNKHNYKMRNTICLRLTNSFVMVPGDVLLVTAFLSYMGCFTRKYRHDLMFDHWLPFLEKLEVKIPRTTDLDILALLTDDAQIAQWNNEGEYIFLYFFIYYIQTNVILE